MRSYSLVESQPPIFSYSLHYPSGGKDTAQFVAPTHSMCNTNPQKEAAVAAEDPKLFSFFSALHDGWQVLLYSPAKHATELVASHQSGELQVFYLLN